MNVLHVCAVFLCYALDLDSGSCNNPEVHSLMGNSGVAQAKR